MPVEAACPSCEGKFRLPDAAAGKRIKCPKCKGPLDVPPLGSGAPANEPVAPAAQAPAVAPATEGLRDTWRASPPVAEAPKTEPPKPEPPKPEPPATKVSPPVGAPTKPVAPMKVEAPAQAAASAAPTKPSPPKPEAPKFEPPKFEPPKPEKKPVEKKPEPVRVEPKAPETKPTPKPTAPPPEMWFLRGEDGESFGPVDRATLQAWHDEGRMSAESQLLKQGTDQWQWASDLFPDLEEPEEEPSPAPAAGSSIHRDEPEPAASRSGTRGKTASHVRQLAANDQDEVDEETGERLSPHSKPVAFLLALTLGMFGIHRFYLGYVGIGLAMFFTFGGLLMWSLTDALRILFGHVTDSEGLKLRD